MFSRRRFLHTSVLGSLALFFKKGFAATSETSGAKNNPIVVSTWAPNVKANAEAWKFLTKGSRAVDSVEAGVQIPEADAADVSVGYGGLPDRDGRVTLDACIMDEFGNAGAVMFLEGIKHPVKLARMVMEKTPHIQLVGEGALQFALAEGFRTHNLLTPGSERAWKEWLKTSTYDPQKSVELLHGDKNRVKGQQDDHDTIGMIALDMHGNLGGACSTSGMAFKMRGRVGDSPIIGAGLYVDNEIGAATATGVGEEVLRICGAHLVTEFMRQGLSPREACRMACRRLVNLRKEKLKNIQVGFIAINKKGEHGGYALQKGFNYAVHDMDGVKVINTDSIF